MSFFGLSSIRTNLGFIVYRRHNNAGIMRRGCPQWADLPSRSVWTKRTWNVGRLWRIAARGCLCRCEILTLAHFWRLTVSQMQGGRYEAMAYDDRNKCKWCDYVCAYDSVNAATFILTSLLLTRNLPRLYSKTILFLYRRPGTRTTCSCYHIILCTSLIRYWYYSYILRRFVMCSRVERCGDGLQIPTPSTGRRINGTCFTSTELLITLCYFQIQPRIIRALTTLRRA